MTPSPDYVKLSKDTEGLPAAIEKLGVKGNPQTAAAVEFVLEGLHLNKRLNKDKVAGRYQYRG
jgi:magnesium chelatase subunit I